jgi:uncharacterized membrane protein
MKTTSFPNRFLPFALIVGLHSIPTIASSQTPENLPKIEGLYNTVADINNSELIVGGAIDLTNGGSLATKWSNGTVFTLPIPEGFTWSSASAVNDDGVIVGSGGSSNEVIEPLVWVNGLPVVLETKGFGGAAYDVNKAGDIVGYVNTDRFTAPALWRNGQLIILPGLFENGGIATAIDDQGRVAGTSQGVNDGSGGQVPTQWVKNLPVALPVTFGQDYIGVLGVNRSGGGRTSGYVIEKRALEGDPYGYFVSVAVGWQDGEFRQLQNPSGNGGSVAYGVNASGLYAGYTTAPFNGPRIPTVWDQDGPIALPLEADRQAIAVAANDKGVVVGSDTTDARNPTPILWRLNSVSQLQMANVQASAGQSIALQARATRNGAALPNQTVSFKVNGKTVSSVRSDATGVARLTYRVPFFARGKQEVTASLSSGRLVSRNIIVGKSTSVAAITPASATRGKPLVLRANLSANETNVPLANRRLSFVINGKVVGTAMTSSRGVASFTHQVPATSPLATLQLEVRYAGDLLSNASVGRASITVVR